MRGPMRRKDWITTTARLMIYAVMIYSIVMIVFAGLSWLDLVILK
jgi:hypothetical protein